MFSRDNRTCQSLCNINNVQNMLYDYSQSLLLYLLTQTCVSTLIVNTLRPRQNGRRFADDTFKRIFLNENVRISIKISPKFVPKSPINNNPALVQIMAWRRSGDKPSSEPMMVSLLTHFCVARPQWVNTSFFIVCLLRIDIFAYLYYIGVTELPTKMWKCLCKNKCDE